MGDISLGHRDVVALDEKMLSPGKRENKWIRVIMTGRSVDPFITLRRASGRESAKRSFEANADAPMFPCAPLAQLAPAKLSLAAKTWMGALRLYLVVAVALVLFRVVMLAIGHG